VEIFIIRHAKAGDPDDTKWPDDTQRPLTRAGAREFERVAERLRRWRPDVDMVLSSGWTRAWQTAEILRACARWPKPARTKLLETHSAGGVAPLVQLLAEQPGDARIALVGHQPVLGLLVADLCSDASARIVMRKGAVAWLEGEPGAMALAGLLVPRMLRGAE
jgi:phosphohistidine phosphatase